MKAEGGDGSLGEQRTRVAKAKANGDGGRSRRIPSRVRNDPATPPETCAGVRTARVPPLPRVRSLAKAVTAEFTKRRVNSRTASASTADDANDADTGSEVVFRSDRARTTSDPGPSTIGVMVVLLGRRTPAPEMEGGLCVSRKQLNSSGATMQRTAIVRAGSVAARTSRLDHGKGPFSSGVDWTGPSGLSSDCVPQETGPTSKSGRRDIGNEWGHKPSLIGPSHELLCAAECRAISRPQVAQNVLTTDGVIRSDVLFPEGASAGAN
jgi:hypothetical protein